MKKNFQEYLKSMKVIGDCDGYVSLDYLMQETGYDEERAINAITNLSNLGWLEDGAGKLNKYGLDIYRHVEHKGVD